MMADFEKEIQCYVDGANTTSVTTNVSTITTTVATTKETIKENYNYVYVIDFIGKTIDISIFPVTVVDDSVDCIETIFNHLSFATL